MTSKRSTPNTLLTVLAIGCSFLTHQVYAADSGKTGKQETKEEKILEKISKEGRMAVQELRWARVAIFDGDVNQAKELLNKSKTTLTEVEKTAPQVMVTVKAREKIGDKTVGQEKTTMASDLVPIDASLVLAEDFVANPGKTEKIKQANEHLKNQNAGKAVEVLHEADIGLSVSRVLLPVKDTIKHVDDAIGLINDSKYYEANLALKTAEDGLIIDTVLLHEPLRTQTEKKK